ncbi:MAG: alpha/beta hydrolase [Burkholderiales bacterium]|nr:alpha/beta hydrolase [Burkholderiales bacterium]MDE1928924.1 alpha/beta hydrolase [Burkholderiales bacterium]MDE2147178.1 alpha/beta hydrolase [Burkholderiales bacterium]MDE2504736.1 alpha/beta hydrolase [Burkholderiales bacterium]
MRQPPGEAPRLTPIVLIHGAWGGAWIWRRVLAPLRAAGHEVHAVTLTGDGERAHLRRREIRLADHVADVVALVAAEELEGVLLVGHSYGGMVATGAADRLLERRAGAVQGLIYVDAMVPLPGEGWGQKHGPEIVAARTAAAQANDGALPAPDPADFGLAGADRDWLLRRQVPHPFGPYRDPLAFDGARWAALPRAFIDCVAPAYPTIAAMRERVRALPGFEVVTMATGHCPMVSSPQELVRHLLALAQRMASISRA